jgi:hypothetical protein
MTDPNAVQTGNSSGVDQTNPPGGGSIAETASAYASAVPSVVSGDPGFGPSGMSITSTLTASLGGSINAGVAPQATAGSTSSTIDPTTGATAPMTWTLTDPSSSTATITATFSLTGTFAANLATNVRVWEVPQLTLVTPEITVNLNTAGVVGLQITDNTAPGGPTVVYQDPNAGVYMGTPSFDPPQSKPMGGPIPLPRLPCRFPSRRLFFIPPFKE